MAQIADLKESQQELANLVAQMDRLLKEKLKALEQVQQEKQVLTVEVEKHIQSVAEVSSEHQSLRSEFDNLEKSYQEVRRECEQLHSALTQCDAKTQSLQYVVMVHPSRFNI